MALAEGVVEGIVDQLRADAEARCLVAIDRDGELRGVVEKVARYVRQDGGQGLHLGEYLARPVGEFADVGILQRILILPARQPAADRDVLRHLHEHGDALEGRELRAQPADDLIGIRPALLARLQGQVVAAGVAGIGGAGIAQIRAKRTRCPDRGR